MSACNSGQFSQSQLYLYNYTNCRDRGLGALDNITYLCLCQPGYVVIGNILTQYFFSELCAPPTSGIRTFTTRPDTKFTPIMISLFCVTIALGLVAIGAVALNVVIILKTVKVKANTDEKGELSGE